MQNLHVLCLYLKCHLLSERMNFGHRPLPTGIEQQNFSRGIAGIFSRFWVTVCELKWSFFIILSCVCVVHKLYAACSWLYNVLISAGGIIRVSLLFSFCIPKQMQLLKSLCKAKCPWQQSKQYWRPAYASSLQRFTDPWRLFKKEKHSQM